VLRSFKELDDVPVESWPSLQPTDDSAYMNHSCDPTGVFAPACMHAVRGVGLHFSGKVVVVGGGVL
jgi:hypothetical protein